MTELLSSDHHYRVLALPVLIGVVVLITIWLRQDRRIDKIPGPKGYPLIGIGYKLPPKTPAVFRQWASQYGELFKVRMGWYNWVVINSPEAVGEILEKQGVNTASKVPMPMGHDVVTGGMRLPTMPYSPRWRAQRSIMRQITSVPMTSTFTPSQEFETKQLLFDLATDNANQRNFYMHMRRFAFSTIMTNTFGRRMTTWDHPDVHNAAESQELLRSMTRPGAFIVDMFPPLARLPSWLQPGRRIAEDACQRLLDIKMGLWRRLEKQHEAGRAPACFGREILENKQSWYKQGLTDEDLAWVAGGLVEAGFETSAATLCSLIVYLATNPRVQSAALEELTRVVGTDRNPTFADMRELPYVRACVKEGLRMNPLLSPGIRFYTEKDVTYKDYVIPKGTGLIINTSSLHSDTERFNAPHEFRPERYIDYELYSSEYAAMSDWRKRDHYTFSVGRRTCPGARLAENSLDIAIANILWAFEVKPPLVDGVEVPVDSGDDAWFLDTGFTAPKPFAVRFVPRSEEKLRIIQEQWQTAMKEGYELRGVTVDVDGMVQY